MYKYMCIYCYKHTYKSMHICICTHSFYTNSKGRGLYFYPMIEEVVMLQEAQSYPC